MAEEIERLYQKPKGIGPRIAAIGGGTGLSVLLRGLKNITDNLTAIVTVADDGGGSGVLREDLGMLPPGDVRSCILALSEEEGVMLDLLNYRFSEGRLAGQSFGNLLIAALNGIFGNFEEAVTKAGDILRIKGTVLPVTGEDVRLCASLQNGELVRGESRIGARALKMNSPIRRVFLEPENPLATKGAISAILEADVIVMGPGSLYSSIIPNFLVNGVSEAIRESHSAKILVCNMMTQPGETDGFSVRDHIDQVNEYIGAPVVEYAIANNRPISEADLNRYTDDGSCQIVPTAEDRRWCEERDIRLIAGDFTDIRKGYIRHNADRIASIVIGLTID